MRVLLVRVRSGDVGNEEQTERQRTGLLSPLVSWCDDYCMDWKIQTNMPLPHYHQKLIATCLIKVGKPPAMPG